MNAGAAIARGDVLLFLHADTRLPTNADELILEGLAQSRRAWGRFDVSIDGKHPLLPVVAASMNTRSRLTGIATGDQAMFVTRDAFDAAGGFPEIALMEDIELSRRLKRISPPLCLRARVTTSGRRWERRGVVAHDPADVAAAARAFLRRVAREPRAALQRLIPRRQVLSVRRADGRAFPHNVRDGPAPSGDASWLGSSCSSLGFRKSAGPWA